MWGVAVQMDANNTLVIYNNIAGNTGAGVSVAQLYGYEPVGTVIRFNSIVGNALGVENYRASTDIDAALNWLGDPEGPTHASNPNGSGDRVSDNVIYSSWLGTDPDGDPLEPGVQITGPMRIIVASVGPEPLGGYLNTAIAGANELPYADTIEVRHGTYDASMPITDAVTLVSEPGSTTNAFLTGNMTLGAAGILIGRMGQGFTVYGDIAVPTGVDASAIHINWNNILGTVTNNGLGTLDATYNWWGGAHPRTRTSGAVDHTPYLPAPVEEVLEFMEDHGVGADAAIFLMERGGLLSEGLLILELMERFGLTTGEAKRVLDEYGFLRVSHALATAFDYDDFARLVLGYGACRRGWGVCGPGGGRRSRCVPRQNN